jgi:hypothetical protein
MDGENYVCLSFSPFNIWMVKSINGGQYVITLFEETRNACRILEVLTGRDHMED